MTTIKIEIAGEDDMAACRQLEKLCKMICEDAPRLRTGYSTGNVYGNAVASVEEREEAE